MGTKAKTSAPAPAGDVRWVRMVGLGLGARNPTLRRGAPGATTFPRQALPPPPTLQAIHPKAFRPQLQPAGNFSRIAILALKDQEGAHFALHLKVPSKWRARAQRGQSIPNHALSRAGNSTFSGAKILKNGLNRSFSDVCEQVLYFQRLTLPQRTQVDENKPLFPAKEKGGGGGLRSYFS